MIAKPNMEQKVVQLVDWYCKMIFHIKLQRQLAQQFQWNSKNDDEWLTVSNCDIQTWSHHTHFMLWYLKNSGVHAWFKINWTPYNVNAVCAFPWNPPPSRYTRYDAYPIPAYNDVHTGANTQFGGLKDGLFSEAYHGFKFWDVILPLTNPPKLGKIIAAAIWNLELFNSDIFRLLEFSDIQ